MTEANAATVRALGEFGLIDRIAGLTGTAAGTVTGIGDDTAVLDAGGPRLLLATVDIQVENRHFIAARATPYQIGRRTAAINLSDIGAMGGRPRWALVSLALPPVLPVAWVEEFYRGLTEELARFEAAVVGGNLSSSDQIVIDLTLLGEAERGRVVLRAGAQPGDLLLVTGALGRSAAGRLALDAGLDASHPTVGGCVAAHFTPAPRVGEGRAIAQSGAATAMMDLSDGLAGDLQHLCDRSGVGVELDVDRLPVDAATRALAVELGVSAEHLALTGGEDYELLFAVRPDAVEDVRRAVLAVAGVPATVIGRITAAVEGRWLSSHGVRRPLTDEQGWDHFRPNQGGG